MFALLNGMVLHFFGAVLSSGKVAEAGMRIALRRAGFAPMSFRNEGRRFFVEAKVRLSL